MSIFMSINICPHKAYVMVNFMCKLDWARGPDIQLNIISGCVYEAISG